MGKSYEKLFKENHTSFYIYSIFYFNESYFRTILYEFFQLAMALITGWLFRI